MKNTKDLKNSLKSELIPTGTPVNEANEMRAMINKHSRIIEQLSNELKAAVGKASTNSPLAAVGSLLTGEIADALHELCNPGLAPVVGYPGLTKASYLRANHTPLKSIALFNGQSRIICTPFGRYSVYSSAAVNVPLTAGFTFPKIVLTANLANQSYDITFRADPVVGNPHGVVSGIFTTMSQNFQTNFVAGSGVVMDVPPSLVGSVINFAGAPYNVVEPGLTSWGTAAFVPPAGATVANAAVPVGSYTDFMLTINWITFAQDGFGTEIQIPFAPGGVANNLIAGLPTWTFLADLSTYNAYAAPSIVGAIQGGYLTKYATVAASALVGSDASALSDGGYVNALTIASRAVAPAGLSFEDWVSGQGNWFYKGQLKCGTYQIYIPEKLPDINSDIITYEMCPFYGNFFYNMITVINNSFLLQGGAYPIATQAHVTYESVFATTDIANLVSAMTAIEDPGWRVAVSLLRANYNPCCNPDHMDQIVDWLSKTMHTLSTYGTRLIKNPSVRKTVEEIVKKGLPMAASIAKVAVPAAISLL